MVNIVHVFSGVEFIMCIVGGAGRSGGGWEGLGCAGFVYKT